MILFWFSHLVEKLPSILQNGSQNCFLGVRMNVSTKSKPLERLQSFYQFRTSSENFLDFWQRFSADLSKQPCTRPERTFEKKKSEGCFNLLSFAEIEHFFWFLAKVFHLLSIMRFRCPQERVQNFFAATFLLLSFSVFEQEFFDFWPSFFSTRLPEVHSTYTEEKFYGFSRNFLVFFQFLRLWAENFAFWQNLVAGLWKLLFYVYRRALWRQTFLEGVLIFHPSRILVIFSLLLEKRLLEWLLTLQSTFTGERSGNVLVFKFFPSVWDLEWKGIDFWSKIFGKFVKAAF